MLSVKQDGTKYHFFSLWYDLTLISWTIGEHFKQYADGLVTYYDQVIK